MNTGLKIAKPGYSIATTDPTNLIFTSSRGVFGYRQIKNITLTTGADGKVEGSHNHAFGYIPMVIVSVTTYGGSRIFVPNQWNTGWDRFGEAMLEENFYYYLDANYIYLKVYAHHYQLMQGGDDTPLSSRAYIFRIVYFYNELNEEV
jgi:hypothetical protein